MTRTIAFDLTRLFLGPLSLTPRGIDRVDLTLASHFFGKDSPHLGVLPTPWGIRVYRPDQIRRGLDFLTALWAENVDRLDDPLMVGLMQMMCGRGAGVAKAARNLRLWDKSMRMLQQLKVTGVSLGRPVGTTLPRGSVYLNVGQIGLAVPQLFRWLPGRPDVTAAFLIHDVIPLEFPAYVEPASVAPHARMIRTASHYGHAIITTTEHARETIRRNLAKNSRSDVRTLVRKLPLPETFNHVRTSPDELSGKSYFVVCATVEPRKNHRLLFDIWSRLVEMKGADAPHLVIVGSKGWQGDRILSRIRMAGLEARVHHVAGMSTPSLIRLLLGASALLSPSIAEGFGLPVLEANALRVPTLASDIAPHREIANRDTVLLPISDIDAWIDAILRQTPPSNPRRTPKIPAENAADRYCSDVEAFLEECARSKMTAHA